MKTKSKIIPGYSGKLDSRTGKEWQKRLGKILYFSVIITIIATSISSCASSAGSLIEERVLDVSHINFYSAFTYNGIPKEVQQLRGKTIDYNGPQKVQEIIYYGFLPKNIWEYWIPYHFEFVNDHKYALVLPDGYFPQMFILTDKGILIASYLPEPGKGTTELQLIRFYAFADIKQISLFPIEIPDCQLMLLETQHYGGPQVTLSMPFWQKKIYKDSWIIPVRSFSHGSHNAKVIQILLPGVQIKF